MQECNFSHSNCIGNLLALVLNLKSFSFCLVNVLRDQFPPVFTRDSYSTIVLENATVSAILNVPDFAARDPDLRGQIEYRVIGDGLAPVFFELNANNRPAVRNPLTQAPNDQYIVSYFNKIYENLRPC